MRDGCSTRGNRGTYAGARSPGSLPLRLFSNLHAKYSGRFDWSRELGLSVFTMLLH